jgi:quinol monooxygenase YgiN
MVPLQLRDTATIKGLIGLLLGGLFFVFFFLIMTSTGDDSLLGGNASNAAILRRTETRRDAVPEDIFTLCVTLQFNHPEGVIAFGKIFKPYAEWLAQNELTTLSYQLMHHDTRPLEVMVLERYLTKDAYLNVHRKTKEFSVFKEKFTLLLSGRSGETTFMVSGNSYYDIDGFG